MASKSASNHGGSTEGSVVSARTLVVVAFVAGALAFAIAILLTPWQVATLTGWIVSAVVFLGWVWLRVARMDSAATAKLATTEDHSRRGADLTLISASLLSLVGVAFALLKAAGERGGAKGLITAVAVLSLVLSWAVVHTVFTLRYATLYYFQGTGIEFSGARPPDYRDFAYLAFTIGMTYQVSDTTLTAKPIRMTALRHAFLSFVFGTSVIATTINVVADLFKP